MFENSWKSKYFQFEVSLCRKYDSPRLTNFFIFLNWVILKPNERSFVEHEVKCLSIKLQYTKLEVRLLQTIKICQLILSDTSFDVENRKDLEKKLLTMENTLESLKQKGELNVFEQNAIKDVVRSKK